MSYEFTGFFAAPAIQRPITLPEGTVWRNIETPFVGVGVKLVERDNDAPLPSQTDVLGLLRQVSLSDAQRWLFLTYVCWSGLIDFVYGMGSRDGQIFGPAQDDEVDSAGPLFASLMKQFGVDLGDRIYFAPFVRGYWDER